MEYLDRAGAPLTAEEWARIDAAVVAAARRTLVGRRVIELVGPLGAGVYTLPYAVYCGQSPAGVDMIGDEENLIVQPGRRTVVELPMLYKDFKLMWRDIEADRRLWLPLDVSAAMVAADHVAVQEDNLIFNGNAELGHQGLFTAEDRQTVSIGNWSEPGAALADVVKAIENLGKAGFYGPYAMVTSPSLYSKMIRVYGNTGVLEIDQIKSLITQGVYYSNVISGDKAVVMATGAQNVAIAVGQDMITAYLGAGNMNHLFRVLETVALLIRRPKAICTIE